MMEHENLQNPISRNELERRWTAARKVMADRNIDALIMQNSTDHLGGYVRWFTDLPAYNGSPRTVIFDKTEPMTAIQQGPMGVEEDLSPDDPIFRGTGRKLFSPSYIPVHYTRHYDAECAVREIRRRGYRTVGMVGTAGMYFEFGTRLKELLDGVVTFVDATEEIDHLKAIKSPEEIAWIRKTATMQDKIMERVLSEIKPGMKDFEVTALAQYTGHLMGSEQGTFNGASARLGVPSSVMWHRHEQGRTIKPGDHLNLLVENNGPGGFYTEISRTFVFGRASNELRDSFELCKAAQKATVETLRLGLPCADVFRAHTEYMVAHGGREEKRLYAHGQGYDLVERPLIRHDETMTIEAGMNLAVHPTLSTSSVFMIVCDNFLMNADGSVDSLHHFKQDLFEL
jgi:Xaa-Pro aminopeptidase